MNIYIISNVCVFKFIAANIEPDSIVYQYGMGIRIASSTVETVKCILLL